MPGIYLQDGGETGSALSSALAGIANNFSPKTRAEAELLRQQTEAADRNNWLLSTRQRGVLSIPGVTGAPGVNADPTASAVPSVADTLAGAAVPPVAAPSTALGTRDQTAGFSPFNAVLAGSYAADPSMGNLTTGINLGRNATLGPGHGFDTGSAIEQAQSTPQHVGAGDKLVINPKLGDAPGNVVQGPDPSAIAAQTKNLEDTTAEAHQADTRGRQAISDRAELADIIKGYDALINIPDGDISNPAVLEGLKAATAATGGAIDFARIFSSKQEAIDDLTKRMQAMWGSGRALGGDPTLRGYGDVMSKSLDVAKNSAPSFHRMADVFDRQLQNLQDEGTAAQPFLDKPTADAASALRNTWITNRQRRADELRKSGFSADTSAGGGGGGGSQPPAPPAAPPGKRWIWNPKTGQVELQ
jgi:hypothetical protein